MSLKFTVLPDERFVEFWNKCGGFALAQNRRTATPLRPLRVGACGDKPGLFNFGCSSRRTILQTPLSAVKHQVNACTDH